MSFVFAAGHAGPKAGYVVLVAERVQNNAICVCCSRSSLVSRTLPPPTHPPTHPRTHIARSNVVTEDLDKMFSKRSAAAPKAQGSGGGGKPGGGVPPS